MLRARTGLSPELLRGEAGAFGEAAQFGPGEVGMDPAAEAAIGAGDDVLAADDLGIAQDAIGDELRVLDEVGGRKGSYRSQVDERSLEVAYIGERDGLLLVELPRESLSGRCRVWVPKSGVA